MIQIKNPDEKTTNESNHSPFDKGGAPQGAGDFDVAPAISTPSTPIIPQTPPKPAPRGLLGRLNGIRTRLKRVKHIEIYAAVAVIALMILIFFSSMGGKKITETPTNGNVVQTSSFTSNLSAYESAYIRELESRLSNILSTIKGAGKVNVMIMASGSAGLELAYNVDEKNITQSNSKENSTSTTQINKSPVLVNGKEPIVLYEIKPQISGIFITATGADNLGVRINISNAVRTLLADNSIKIDVQSRSL